MSKRRTTPCKLAAQVGARIRLLRLESGWSLKTLGKLAESSVTGLHAIETGQTAIRVDTLRRIARALRDRLQSDAHAARLRPENHE